MSSCRVHSVSILDTSLPQHGLGIHGSNPLDSSTNRQRWGGSRLREPSLLPKALHPVLPGGHLGLISDLVRLLFEVRETTHESLGVRLVAGAIGSPPDLSRQVGGEIYPFFLGKDSEPLRRLSIRMVDRVLVTHVPPPLRPDGLTGHLDRMPPGGAGAELTLLVSHFFLLPPSLTHQGSWVQDLGIAPVVRGLAS